MSIATKNYLNEGTTKYEFLQHVTWGEGGRESDLRLLHSDLHILKATNLIKYFNE